MAFRTEVKTARGWTVLDEHRDVAGERPLTRTKYERGVRRIHPILATREYRVTEFDAPPIRSLFTISIPLNRAAERLIR